MLHLDRLPRPIRGPTLLLGLSMMVSCRPRNNGLDESTLSERKMQASTFISSYFIDCGPNKLYPESFIITDPGFQAAEKLHKAKTWLEFREQFSERLAEVDEALAEKFDLFTAGLANLAEPDSAFKFKWVPWQSVKDEASDVAKKPPVPSILPTECMKNKQPNWLPAIKREVWRDVQRSGGRGVEGGWDINNAKATLYYNPRLLELKNTELFSYIIVHEWMLNFFRPPSLSTDVLSEAEKDRAYERALLMAREATRYVHGQDFYTLVPGFVTEDLRSLGIYMQEEEQEFFNFWGSRARQFYELTTKIAALAPEKPWDAEWEEWIHPTTNQLTMVSGSFQIDSILCTSFDKSCRVYAKNNPVKTPTGEVTDKELAYQLTEFLRKLAIKPQASLATPSDESLWMEKIDCRLFKDLKSRKLSDDGVCHASAVRFFRVTLRAEEAEKFHLLMGRIYVGANLPAPKDGSLILGKVTCFLETATPLDGVNRDTCTLSAPKIRVRGTGATQLANILQDAGVFASINSGGGIDVYSQYVSCRGPRECKVAVK